MYYKILHNRKCCSAQYKIKRINFLIYFYIAPGNFSLLAQRKVAENSPYGIRYL